jgi:hypothetical protein
MKIYRINLVVKIPFITFILFYIGIVMGVYFADSCIFLPYIDISIIIFLLGGVHTLFSFRIRIADKDITSEMYILTKKLKKSIAWNDVELLNSGYFLYPDSGWISLVPKDKTIPVFHLGMGGMSIELAKDIIAHLPKEAKVDLYPYLKRKLQGRQTYFFNSEYSVETAGQMVGTIKVSSRGSVWKEFVGFIMIGVMFFIAAIILTVIIYYLTVHSKSCAQFFENVSVWIQKYHF